MNDANAVALFDSSQYHGPNPTGQNSRDGHVAHTTQDLELECQCELRASEITRRSETYRKEEEIDPVAKVSVECTR